MNVDILEGMINVEERTELENKTLSKILELLNKEGPETTKRLLAAVLSYIFKEEERKSFSYGHFRLFNKMLTSTIRNGRLHKAPLSGRHYADHYYGRKDKETGEESIILQPYSISSESLKDLITLCEWNGLEFSITGESEHFPGSTIKIEITEKEKCKNERKNEVQP
ncbi:hypothetical protein ACNF40_08485 [Cuniculiplasma sp. SKW4]|uniref:hypothetical protein n=1 Tax=Cuniculiplasma sp. SKW4 TaxID=3400171 RepID=UPI003FD24255